MTRRKTKRSLKSSVIAGLGLGAAIWFLSGCSVTPLPIPNNKDAGPTSRADSAAADMAMAADFGAVPQSDAGPGGDARGGDGGSDATGGDGSGIDGGGDDAKAGSDGLLGDSVGEGLTQTDGASGD